MILREPAGKPNRLRRHDTRDTQSTRHNRDSRANHRVFSECVFQNRQIVRFRPKQHFSFSLANLERLCNSTGRPLHIALGWDLLDPYGEALPVDVLDEPTSAREDEGPLPDIAFALLDDSQLLEQMRGRR